jgi:periplasmic divalent cation tolerance protein
VSASTPAVRLVYVTTKNAEEARAIAEDLLERRLVACANILPQMQSIYRWNGKIQNDSESVLILKTPASQVEQVTLAIKKLHSYEIPCVLSIPIESGSVEYLAWIVDQV